MGQGNQLAPHFPAFCKCTEIKTNSGVEGPWKHWYSWSSNLWIKLSSNGCIIDNKGWRVVLKCWRSSLHLLLHREQVLAGRLLESVKSFDDRRLEDISTEIDKKGDPERQVVEKTQQVRNCEKWELDGSNSEPGERSSANSISSKKNDMTKGTGGEQKNWGHCSGTAIKWRPRRAFRNKSVWKAMTTVKIYVCLQGKWGKT